MLSESSIGVLECFEGEYRRLIDNSISLNTWNVYDNAVKTLESFRCEMSLEQKWPVPLSDLINCIAFL
jgi:hypothetical protein